jgi:hypothetical protein
LVFTSAQAVQNERVIYEHQVGDTTYIAEEDEDIGFGGERWNGECDTLRDLSSARGASDWVDAGPDEAVRAHHFPSYFGAPQVGYTMRWFILGGSLGGTDIVA